MAASSTRLHLLLVFLVLSCVHLSVTKAPCDPLVPGYCLLPFPSSYYLQRNASTKTGYSVHFPVESFPRDSFGRQVKPEYWNTFDGFTPFPSILAYFANLSSSNLPPHWNISDSLSATSPTILLNADTGEKVPHWAELDEGLLVSVVALKHTTGMAGRTVVVSDNQRAFMLWPAKRLQDNSHYIVALRSLRDTTGRRVQPSAAFRCLRDRFWCNDSDVDGRRELFERIFATLEAAGIGREDLQLTWDFHTASRESLTQRLLFARDDALKRVGSDGPSYEVFQMEDKYSTHIFRKVVALMRVPYYTTTVLPGARLVLDSNGLPVYQGLADVRFTVLVPNSLANGTLKPSSAGLIQYGHGLFSNQDEVEDGYLQEIADRHGYVLVACDWWGLADYDVAAIVTMMATDISDFVMVPDRLTQGMVNALNLMRLMKGRFAKDSTVSFHGESVINSKNTYYYGNSLGGIMGEVYMAMSQDVVRGTLGVAGGPMGLLLPRSIDYTQFAVGQRLLFPDAVNYTVVTALMDLVWSRLAPTAYMSYITADPLPDTPTHRILYHYAPGDAEVNIITTLSIARSANAVMFESNVKETYWLLDGSLVTDHFFGFKMVGDNVTVTQDSVVIGFNCGAPPEPAVNRHPDAQFDTHECPRNMKVTQEQINVFFSSGEIKNLCGGPCSLPAESQRK